jgi:hypothetical protein
VGTVTTPADGFLHLLKAEPELLPSAESTVPWHEAITHRGRDEVHPCLRCGARARRAYIVHTNLGPRWLDLCPGCDMWVRTGATLGGYAP